MLGGGESDTFFISLPAENPTQRPSGQRKTCATLTAPAAWFNRALSVVARLLQQWASGELPWQ
ncbi:MAG: hypothetical protein H0X67_10085 [Acidobacteria bacterium]|nr:hypothetical protein [Acidobacteriota bacterium]